MLIRFRLFPICVVSLFFMVAASFSQIPNSGFEDWTNGNPDGWATGNVPTLYSPVTESNVAHLGSHAVRGDVVSYFGTPVGALLQSGLTGEGFAFTQRPEAFTGYYEFFPQSGDRFGINVELFNGGIGGTLVGIAAASPSATVSSYTQFSVPFIYQTNDMPDLCVVQILIAPPEAGGTYHVGTYFILDDIALTGTVGAVANRDNVPTTPQLAQNYPNPFNPSTKISYSVANSSAVKLTVTDVLGKEVATLVSGRQAPGTYTETWDATSQPAGVYFYKLVTNNIVKVKKMLLVK